MTLRFQNLARTLPTTLKNAAAATGTSTTSGPSRSATAYTLYADPGFLGPSYSGTTSVSDLKTVDGALGYGTSALVVNPGYSITVFTGTGFTGTQSTIQGPAYMTSIAKIPPFNDNIRSIQVNTVGGTYMPTGKTVSATVNQPKPLQNMDYSMCGRNTICYNTNVATPTSPVSSAIDWVTQDPITCSGAFDSDSRRCSPLDASVCPLMATTADSVFWTTPSNVSYPGGRSVTCTYDTGQFTNNVAALQNWSTYAWTNQAQALDQFNNTLMPAFCGQQVNTCSLNPITSTQPAQCSRFAASSGTPGHLTDGDLCRAWKTNALNKDPGYTSALSNTDTTMRDYCTKNNTPDCLCINRAQDPDYKTITGIGTSTVNPLENFGKDSCWWKPCMFPDSIMRTSELDVGAGDCNIQVCQFLLNLQNVVLSTVAINKIQATQNCTFSGNSGTHATSSIINRNGQQQNLPSDSGLNVNGAGANIVPPSGTPTGATPTGPSTGATPTTSSKKWIYIIIAIVIIIIIIIAAVAIFAFTRKKTPIEPIESSGIQSEVVS